MSDHAPPMKDQTKIWIRTWRTYWRMPPIDRTGPRASTEQRPGDPRHRAADGRGDQIDALRVGAHQRHRLAVLGDGADRGADVGPTQEDPEADHREERDGEGDQPDEREEHAADLEDRERQADGPVVGGPEERRERLEEEEEPARREELVDGRASEDRRDDQEVHAQSQQRPERHRREAGEPEGPAVDHHQEVDEVHADHDEVDVGDPDDVDDAEDEVQAERQERQDAAQEDAVHGRFEEEDRVDHSPTYAFRTKSCSLSAAARPSILIRPTSSRYARSTSFSTWRTFCSTTRIV